MYVFEFKSYKNIVSRTNVPNYVTLFTVNDNRSLEIKYRKKSKRTFTIMSSKCQLALKLTWL